MNHETSMFIFLENLRRLRKREGLSMREMAKKLGVGVKTLEQMENGIVPAHVSCSIICRTQREFQIEAKLQFSELISLKQT